jgi:hypothetical protein
MILRTVRWSWISPVVNMSKLSLEPVESALVADNYKYRGTSSFSNQK